MTVLIFVLGIDGLDFLLDQLHVVLELLNLSVHLLNKAVAFLAAGSKEAKVVLVSMNFLLQVLILAQQTLALIGQCVLATLGHLFQVILELVQAFLSYRDIQFLIELV